METVEYANAIAYLSEQIDGLKAKQDEYHTKSWEKLELWSKTNEKLVICLEGQSQDNRTSTGTYRALVQHLLTLAQTTQQLTASTGKLEGSSEKLTQYLVEEQAPQLKSLEANNRQLQNSSSQLAQYLIEEQAPQLKILEANNRQLQNSSSQLAQYLIEEQAPQLKSLEANSKQLQASSSNLEIYLKTEQSERLKMLENSLRALLEMIEVEQRKNPSSPTATSSVKNTKLPVKSDSQSTPTDNLTKSSATSRLRKKWSFDAETVITSALVSLLSTAFILIFLKAGGLSTNPVRSVEASEQRATIESAEESAEPASDN